MRGRLGGGGLPYSTSIHADSGLLLSAPSHGCLALAGNFNNAILMGVQSDRRVPELLRYHFFHFAAKQHGTDAKRISLEELIYI